MTDGISERFSAYAERLKHFIDVTSPMSLMYSTSDIKKAQDISASYKKTGMKNCSEEEFNRYQRILDGTVHPATNEIIPTFFRVSAIAPVNVPLVFCMLQCPPSNVGFTLFLHWVNQSYNSACNYANRSGKDQSFESMASAYTIAVGSACSFAYGLGYAYRFAPPSLRKFGVLIPCVATVSANVSNLSFTRMGEITHGSPVMDSEGQVRGLSKIAGRTGVSQTAVTRCMLVPCACLVLPSVIMGMMKRRRLLPASASMVIFIELTIIYASLQLAMPAALAVFPQMSTYDVMQLESEFQELLDSKGNRITHMTANKGL